MNEIMNSIITHEQYLVNLELPIYNLTYSNDSKVRQCLTYRPENQIQLWETSRIRATTEIIGSLVFGSFIEKKCLEENGEVKELNFYDNCSKLDILLGNTSSFFINIYFDDLDKKIIDCMIGNTYLKFFYKVYKLNIYDLNLFDYHYNKSMHKYFIQGC